jgi:hypothetical protein
VTLGWAQTMKKVHCGDATFMDPRLQWISLHATQQRKARFVMVSLPRLSRHAPKIVALEQKRLSRGGVQRREVGPTTGGLSYHAEEATPMEVTVVFLKLYKKEYIL